VKHFTMPRLALALLSTGVLCLSLAPAASAGGNSTNAKMCQKGGWQTLLANNVSFTSEEACVAFAARGGTLVPESQSQIDCQSFGGTFTQVNSGSPTYVIWTCNVPTITGSMTLADDCFSSGGTTFVFVSTPPPYNWQCQRPA
jgi:hypothetical protein